MVIQTGISIAAIAIAIVAIGVSAAMVSSIGQDMTELKSSIEELSQTQSRGAIEQQGCDKIMGDNTGNNDGMIISLIAALVRRSTNFP